ncbi:MAG: J domain-containing protein [Xanthobacteraceae bacterium]
MPVSSEEFSLALVNAVLLALWPVLPGLLLGYARQSAAVRHIRPDFSLRQSEMQELTRAARLYETVCNRLKAIKADIPVATGLLANILPARPELDDERAVELDDLEAHAHHLREAIMRLQRQPLRRLRSWAHVISSKSALGRALATHVAGFVLLLLAFHIPDQPALAGELTTGPNDMLAWYPIDERFFYANAVAAVFAAMAAPVFYLVRWHGLRREYGFEFRTFSELARSQPGNVIERIQIDWDDQESSPLAGSTEPCSERNWFAVLGLSSSATIVEAKEAYKRLIKQNHPDRVHDMSPAFRQLAEAETKKLNVALRQALISASSLGAAADRSNYAA